MASDAFWTGLKEAHGVLRDRYSADVVINPKFANELEATNNLIANSTSFEGLVNCAMPYDLDGLGNKETVIAFVTQASLR